MLKKFITRVVPAAYVRHQPEIRRNKISSANACRALGLEEKMEKGAGGEGKAERG